ncbi:MAG: FG-GAP repeat protein [Planctomycetota bacterium]
MIPRLHIAPHFPIVALMLQSAAFPQAEVLTEVRRFESNNPRAARYGEDVFLAESKAIISVIGDDTLAPNAGLVRIFDRSETGWMQTGVVTAEAFQSNLFADVLELKDGILAAGSLSWPGTSPRVGRGYVWDVVGDRFVFSGTLDPLVALSNEAYGRALAIVDRDAVILTRPGERLDSVRGGTALLFERGASGRWSQTQKFFPSPALAPLFNGFGVSIAYDDGYAIVGSGLARAYVFRRIPNGQFVEHQELIDPRFYFNNDFGASVAIEGDLMAIGDPGDSGSPLPGAVILYRRIQSTWTHEATLLASNGFAALFQGSQAVNDDFGVSVDIDEGRVVVGADNAGRGGQPTSGDEMLGNVYVFEKFGDEWRETYQLQSEEDAISAFYGNRVHMDGDAVLVGARSFPMGGLNNVGAAFAVELPFGERACDGVPNSTGTPAELRVTGDRRASIGRLFLEASDLPAQALTLFLAAPSTGFTPNPGGSQGVLCIDGPVSRFVPLAGLAYASGAYDAQLDMNAIPTPQSGPVAIQPGDTYTFQAWYRDANPGPTSNFSSAVSVRFR